MSQKLCEWVERKCLTCGKSFEVRASKLKYDACNYCSLACAKVAQGKRQFISEKRNCEICGKEFFSQPHRDNSGRGRFCSRKCQSLSMKRRKMVTCLHCGNEFEDRENPTYPRIFCSKKCRVAYFRGENHPNYIDGQGVFHGDQWRSQRKIALKRDGYKCVVCGKHRSELPRGGLHVHHRIRANDFDDTNKANELSNLITLCSSCHRKAEVGRIQI
jgi:endogenous inhibitor of DNA gyrase (YacG/DUF329 family)